MLLRIDVGGAVPLEFECENTIASAWVSRSILENETYPILPFVDDVQVVLDAGGNCGAAAVHFARHYPDATVHTCEPGSLQRAFLERNAAQWPNITIHPIALHREDGDLPLYQGDDDSGMSSLTASEFASTVREVVPVRAAGPWAAEQGIERVDVMKLDVEGCEVDVLQSLGPLMATVKVLYVEYDSRAARRGIDTILAGTHELYAGKVFLDQGEIVYLARAEADKEAATTLLRSLFRPSASPDPPSA